MTNNNWIDEFYENFTDGVDAENGYYDSQFIEGRPCNVESFISNLLNQKDQEHAENEQFYYNRGYLDAKKEHKAELERIKGEIEEYRKNTDGYGASYGFNKGFDDVLSIIDRHINSLTTQH